MQTSFKITGFNIEVSNLISFDRDILLPGCDDPDDGKARETPPSVEDMFVRKDHTAYCCLFHLPV
jgi:hypothetical protein